MTASLPDEPVLDMTYNVFGGTLNLAQLQLTAERNWHSGSSRISKI